MKKISARWRNLYTKAGFSSFMASLLAILCGLVVGFVVLLVADPANAFWGLLAILTGGLSDMKNLGQVLYAATPIILTGLSVGFANKTGLFNIGASGQFIVGAYVAVLMGVKCTFIPGPLLWLACLLGAMLAGAVWGLVPGFLKAVCNVNEVIACIMMNYIGMYGVNFLIQLTVFDSLKNQSLPVAENANAPKLGMDLIFRSGATASSANAGIFIAVLAGVVIYYLIEKTKFGYELKACGYNRDAARYAGINETRSIVLSMVIAGALSGLGGACLYLAGAGKGIEVLDNDTGFFMMVEGGKIDWACHANDAGSTIADTIALSDAVDEAVAFAQQHPDETLILVTGDHETGGLTIGYAGTDYDTFLTNLSNQKISYAKYDSDYVAGYKENNTSFEDVMKDVEALFGLKLSGAEDDKLVLTDYEVQKLKDAYAATMDPDRAKADPANQAEYVLYGTYEPLSVTITHLLNNKSGINFSSYAHTGLPVAVFAQGAGQDLFGGFYDNTQIYHKLTDLLDVK